eukprot:2502725-Amphidinium_carterae.1
MGAKTGRGSGFDVEHPLKNTLDSEKTELRDAVHALAKTHGSHISYTSFVVAKLEKGDKVKLVNPHVDTKNDCNVPNHTVCFGNYEGGHLQVERQGQDGNMEWQIVGLKKKW